ncbi:hypothetical protein LTR10_007401 [Elasticomyces elasticus]|nr:hypothetical protein LTR10_007401 [Elasticomyces elasticus]KAK4979212.1 hypothetical protein LTR42_001715 [Elasticomyces elasticus]
MDDAVFDSKIDNALEFGSELDGNNVNDGLEEATVSSSMVPPLSKEQLIALFNNKKVIAWLQKRDMTPRQRTPKSSPIADGHARVFGGEAKRLMFQTMLDDVLAMGPELNEGNFVHSTDSSGSFKDSVIAALHYPSFTSTQPPYSGLYDKSNPCIRFLDLMFGGMDDIFLYDAIPVRLRRAFPTDRVWDTVLRRKSVTFGEENATRYKKHFGSTAIPISLHSSLMYGEHVHAYLELDEKRDVKRITFLVYHPEAFLRGSGFYRADMIKTTTTLAMSMAFPGHQFRRV